MHNIPKQVGIKNVVNHFVDKQYLDKNLIISKLEIM